MNTIEAHLRAIMVLELACRILDIDLTARLKSSKLLLLFEVERIVDLCKQRLERILPLLEVKEVALRGRNVKIMKLYQKLPTVPKRDAITSYRDRVAYIRDYVNERALRALYSLDRDNERYLRLETARVHTFEMFDARVPARPKPKEQSTSLSESQINDLWRITDPLANENPFRVEFVRYRNSLLMQWLILLGLRRGELLGIRLEDIDWQRAVVRVLRRQDSKVDKRRRPAKAKTIEGEIPLSRDLMAATYEYIVSPNLRKSQTQDDMPFLFLARGGGALTDSALQHIFRKIRESCPALPKKLSSQMCRHTCNYILSLGFEREGVLDTDEAQRRRVLMRWSAISTMPDHYNKRRIKEKAHQSSLKAQNEQYAKRHTSKHDGIK
ncbi:tyrosine-type recombinase/integrase [Massilia brevitalea]|uniref:tyrosine-type recombinase/integrase n=1 Tax=Massilia brevitalea TaxID=442526 RepID=UPI002738F6B2